MTSHSFYLHAHQPCRMKRYTFFDIGHLHDYEDTAANAALTQDRATHMFLPANEKLLRMIDESDGRFKVALSISGITLDQWEQYAPQVLVSFRKLAETGCAEFLAVPYYDSFAFFFSAPEFEAQLQLHGEKIRELFNQTPETFCNTKLIYSDELAQVIEKMKYTAMIVDEAHLMPGEMHANCVYRPDGCHTLALLAVRTYIPPDMSPDGFVNVLAGYDMNGRASGSCHSGIVDFLDTVSNFIIRHDDTVFTVPSEIVNTCRRDQAETIESSRIIRTGNSTLSLWITNEMQHDALHTVYDLTQKAKTRRAPELLSTCRMLQAADHFISMDTGAPDERGLNGCVASQGSPYDAYINFMNIMADVERRICRQQST
jgi:alpha-amylase